jgi:hypothetical protein
MKRRKLPVFGNVIGSGSAGATSAGAGAASAISIGASAGGAGGGFHLRVPFAFDWFGHFAAFSGGAVHLPSSASSFGQ